VVTTNVDDAEVRVDDEVIGRSPLGSLAWYVEPGRHLVTARKDGYLDGTERIDVAIGLPRSVLVKVQRVVGGTSESPAEEPKPAAASAQPRLASDTSSSVAASPEPRRTGVPARTVVLVTGAVLTVGAAAVGTVYAFRTAADSQRISELQAQFSMINPKNPVEACNSPTDPNIAAFCQTVSDDLARQQAHRQVRDIAFITAGVLGVATLATVFVWRPKPTTVAVAPVLNPAAPGFVLSGSF
jgi:hypothetical protein